MIFQPIKLVIVESPYRATEYYTEEQHRLYLPICGCKAISEIRSKVDVLHG